MSKVNHPLHEYEGNPYIDGVTKQESLLRCYRNAVVLLDIVESDKPVNFDM